MSLQIIGLSHKTAPLEVREKLAFKAEDYLSELKKFTDGRVVRESLIISTCNRVEILLEGDEFASYEKVVDFFARVKGISPDYFAARLFHYSDAEAVRHLFRVVASLDSMSVGEGQISGQVREAYALAAEQAGTVSRRLHKLMHHSFRAAKRVKSETGIGASGMSLSSAAVEQAREILGSIKNKTVLLVGAGEMAELAAKHLTTRGAGRILICNRTRESALRLADEFGGEIVEFEKLAEVLPQADVVICSTAAPDYVITAEMVANSQNARKNRPQFYVDLSVPRNVAPEIAEIENAHLADVDGLQEIARANAEAQKREIRRAEQIICEETAAFWEYLPVLDKGEILGLLRDTLLETATLEFERQRARLGDLTDEQTAAIEQILRGAVNKIAHPILYSLGRTRDAAAIEFAEILYTMLGETKSNGANERSTSSDGTAK